MGEIKLIKEQEILGKEFRMYGDINNPLFLAKDVSEWIEHKDVAMMIRKVDEEEKLIQTLFVSGQKRDLWFLTEDGLYELLMQSRKPKAKEFKKAVKAILKQIRMTGGYIPVDPGDDKLTIMSKAMQIMNDTLEQQIDLIEVMKPKADFADTLRKSKDNISIGEFAKTLCDGGFEIGQNRLFKWLKNKKFLLKDNIPYQQYIVNGAFQVKRGIYFEFGGVPKQSIQTVITPKGQLYLFKKIKKDFDSGKIAS